MSYQNEIAANLLKKEAVRFSLNPLFTWVSGIKSPIYCDNRKMIAYPVEREVVVAAFCERIRDLGAEVIAGTATAGIAWAAFVAQKLGLPMVYVRPEKKEHGAGRQIEGDLGKGKKVVLVEDLFSTGGSSVNAADALRQEGKAEVLMVISIMTYEFEECRAKFEEAGLKFESLTNYSVLIGEAKNQGLFDLAEMEVLRKFSQDPHNFYQKI